MTRTDELEGVSRFRVLETVRAGVLEGADAAALATAAADAHAAYWLEATSPLDPGGNGASLAWLDGCADDLRRALDRLSASEPAGALELWARLYPLWASRGRAKEGLARIGRIPLEGPPTPVLARALSRRVALRFAVDGVVAAAADNERALEVARAAGEAASVAEALAGSVMIALETGNVEGARRAADQAAAAAAGIDDPRLRVLVAQSRAFAVSASGGETSPAARDAFLELVLAASGAGDSGLELTARGDLAVTHLYRGEYQAAARAAAEAVRIARELGSPLTPWVEATLAIALAETGRPDEARAAIEAAAAAARGTPERELDVLVASSSVLRATGHPRDALLAAAIARAAIASGGATAQAGDLALLARFDQAAIRETTAVDAELARQDAASIEPSAFLASLPSRLAAKGPGRSAAGWWVVSGSPRGRSRSWPSWAPGTPTRRSPKRCSSAPRRRRSTSPTSRPSSSSIPACAWRSGPASSASSRRPTERTGAPRRTATHPGGLGIPSRPGTRQNDRPPGGAEAARERGAQGRPAGGGRARDATSALARHQTGTRSMTDDFGESGLDSIMVPGDDGST